MGKKKRRTEFMSIRMEPRVKEALQRASDRIGKAPSTFAYDVLVEKLIMLDEVDW